VEEFYVNINQDSKTPIHEYVENDLPFEAFIKMQKKDKDTGKYVTFSNATFQLEKLDEDTNEWKQVKCKVGNQYFDKWTTLEDGTVNTETKLEAGIYKLSECVIPEGFIGLEDELTFYVNNRNETLEYDQDWDAWITVTAENIQPKGKLEVSKSINLRQNVDLSLISDIDFTKISFKLVAAEDIIDYADGSIIYAKDTEVGKYNLDKNAKLTVDNIPMGAYYLQEISTIDGAVLDDTKYDVIFEKKDNVTKEYLVELNIENQTTLVEISKTDITGENEVVGAHLSVLDENENVISEWVSTSQKHTIEGLTVRKNIYFA